MSRERSTFKDQLALNTEEACLVAIKNGWIAASVSLGLTLLVVLVGLTFSSGSETLQYFSNPAMFIDIGFMAILAFFIYKKSRIACSR